MSILESMPQSSNHQISKRSDNENALLDESSDISHALKSNREFDERIKEDFALYMETTNKVKNEEVNEEHTPRDLFDKISKNKLKHEDYNNFDSIDKKAFFKMKGK